MAAVLLTGQAADLTELARSGLSAAEQARAASLDDPAGRRDYQAAHLLVRQVAARVLAVAPDEVTVLQVCERCGGPHGRPFVGGHPELQVSLSHTGGAVIAAASAGPVGADIESLRRPRFDLSLLERELTPAELAAIGRSADQHAAVLRHWTRKEALAKAGGRPAGRAGEIGPGSVGLGSVGLGSVGLGSVDLGYLEMSGSHDRAPARAWLGPAWPRLLILDRVDKVSGIAFAVVSDRPVLLCAASGALAAAAAG